MNEKGFFHIGLQKGLSAKYAILPGDPQRVERIVRCLENSRFVAEKREFTSWMGELEGESVIVTSTGIGGPSAAICVEELIQAGVHTFIRVGTCGAMQKNILAGDLIIPTGAIRMEGTTKEYIPIEYPAVPDFDVLTALADAGKKVGTVHVGVVQSKDSFYGQHSPRTMPAQAELLQKWDAWIKAGALASEMECAALFTVAAVRRARAGAVLMSIWNQELAQAGSQAKEQHDTGPAIIVAVEAVRKLIRKDREALNR